MKIMKLFILLLIALPFLVLVLGQLGLLASKDPRGLGLRDGRLKPPSSTPNSVSSQAALHADHPRRIEAQIDPLAYQGNGATALSKLREAVSALPGYHLVREESGYLYFQSSSRWLKFVDDVEFVLDDAAKLIHVRSASRVGRKDFGVNRARVEAIRKKFNAAK